MDNLNYIGNELEVFSHATNWKLYNSKFLIQNIKGSVLEVGAGIGTNTKFFLNSNVVINSWDCIEPDIKMHEKILINIKNNKSKLNVKIKEGTIYNLRMLDKFDTILYIDVLEHIDDDRNELLQASKHLNDGGNIIILSPSYQFLYSEFDKSIGHFRRYSKKSILKIVPEFLCIHSIIFLDSIGLIASLINKLILKSNNPNKKQILFWDKVLIPISYLFDRLINYKIGRSIIVVLKKP